MWRTASDRDLFVTQNPVEQGVLGLSLSVVPGWVRTMTAMTTPHHQVASATAHLRAIADGVVDASVWSMTAAEAASTLVELTRLAAQVAELTARVAAHADELQVGHEVGATSTANWLAHPTKQTRPAAAGTVRLGLRPGHPRPGPGRARAR